MLLKQTVIYKWNTPNRAATKLASKVYDKTFNYLRVVSVSNLPSDFVSVTRQQLDSFKLPSRQYRRTYMSSQKFILVQIQTNTQPVLPIIQKHLTSPDLLPTAKQKVREQKSSFKTDELEPVTSTPFTWWLFAKHLL